MKCTGWYSQHSLAKPKAPSSKREITHVVAPENAGIERRTLIFFKQLQIHVKNVACLESVHHPQEDIEVTGPFSHNTGYRSGAKRQGISILFCLG